MNTTKTTTTRSVLTRIVAALALAGVLTGLGAGVAAAAESTAGTPPATVAIKTSTAAADDDMNVMSSRQITVTNNTRDTMTLASVEGDKWFEGRPGDGSTIAPDNSHAWELTYKYMKTNANTVVYTLTAPDGSYDGSVTLDLRVESIGVWEPSVKSSCKTISSIAGIKCDAGGSQITLSNA